MKIVHDINLTFVHPPIPERHSDWRATRSDYEPGEPVGYGATPILALTDLLEQEMELEDA